MNLNKKMKVGLILTIVLLIIILLTSLILFHRNRVKFDPVEIEKELLNDYRYLDLYALDEFDVSLYFGLDLRDIPSSLFLTDFEIEEGKEEAFNPKSVVVIINSSESDKYYDFFRDYINMNVNNSEDKKRIDFYKNSILEKGNNYMYFIAGKDKKNIEKTILDLKK